MPHPTINIENLVSFCETTDLGYSVRFSCKEPQVVLIDNFLSGEECQRIIDANVTSVRPVGFYSPEGEVMEAGRTSKACLMTETHGLKSEVEQRIERLTSWPSIMTEPTSFVHYDEGDQIRGHHDFFGSSNRPPSGGQRLATGIIYLDEVANQGQTVFGRLGFTIFPKRGSLLFFSYPEEDKRLHHSSPPLQAVEKNVLVKWFRSDMPQLDE